MFGEKAGCRTAPVYRCFHKVSWFVGVFCMLPKCSKCPPIICYVYIYFFARHSTDFSRQSKVLEVQRNRNAHKFVDLKKKECPTLWRLKKGESPEACRVKEKRSVQKLLGFQKKDPCHTFRKALRKRNAQQFVPWKSTERGWREGVDPMIGGK